MKKQVYPPSSANEAMADFGEMSPKSKPKTCQRRTTGLPREMRSISGTKSPKFLRNFRGPVGLHLKIADVIIQLQSDFEFGKLSEQEQDGIAAERFINFLALRASKPDIVIKVNIVDKLPKVKEAKKIFITNHPDSGNENWQLLRHSGSYIYKCSLKDKKQIILVNETFERATAYLLPKKDKNFTWEITDIIYDFLQVLLINYFALHKKGIFVHSVGIKDINGGGLLFAGESGAGKSTTARLWHKHSRAMVLNDDRIIVRKVNGKFRIYGSPWHGDFADYLDSRIESAQLDKLFFIHHASNNRLRVVPQKTAFSLLYPALFPTFWDKQCLENICSFAEDIVKTVPCFSLGFVNDKKIIPFVRKI